MNPLTTLWWGWTRAGMVCHLFPRPNDGAPSLCRGGLNVLDSYSCYPAETDPAGAFGRPPFPAARCCARCVLAANPRAAEGGAA